MATYTISIGCVTFKRLKGEPLPRSRWTLGRFGLPCNIMGLMYSIWSLFWSFWPEYGDITAANFNWSSVLFAGIMAIAAVYYIVHGRKVYEGPVAKVDRRVN